MLFKWIYLNCITTSETRAHFRVFSIDTVKLLIPSHINRTTLPSAFASLWISPSLSLRPVAFLLAKGRHSIGLRQLFEFLWRWSLFLELILTANVQPPPEDGQIYKRKRENKTRKNAILVISMELLYLNTFLIFKQILAWVLRE